MSGRPFYYILAGHDPVPCADIVAWGRFFADSERRRVALATWGERIRVSTVFLGTDHGWPVHAPEHFETMIFARDVPEEDGHQWRHATWDDALVKHRAIVAELASVFGPPSDSIEAP